MLSPLTQQLVNALSKLPGIGPKSAQRICFKLLKDKKRHIALDLASALQQASDHIQLCQMCRQFSEEECCPTCLDPRRSKESMCVVESPADVMAIEQSHSFSGQYFVLHGHLSPIDGVTPAHLGIDRLLERVKHAKLEELIIATSATMEGEATAHYIAEHLKHLHTRISRIAHGIPMGGELEYLDGNTLSHALKQRKIVFNQEKEVVYE